MKRLTHIFFLLSIVTALAVPVVAAEKEKEKTVQQVAPAMGRVVKVDDGFITVTVRAVKRRGTVISPKDWTDLYVVILLPRGWAWPDLKMRDLRWLKN